MNINFQAHTRLLTFSIFACFCLALLALPIDAIALRNIGLVLGALLSTVAACTLLKSKILNIRFNPAILALFLLLIWVLCHSAFFSIEPTRELHELQSLWLRALLALILGSALGLMGRQSHKLRLAILLVLVLFPLMTYYLGFFSGGSTTHTPFDGFYKSKAAVSYFLLFPLMISFGCMQYLVLGQKVLSKAPWVLATLWCFCILSVGGSLFGFYYSKSLNGLLIAGIFTLIFSLALVGGVTKSRLSKGFVILLSACLLTLAAGSLVALSKHDSKLTNIFQDAYLGTQINTYSNWQNSVDKPWVPIARDGHLVNQSTYYRVANFLNGARFIGEHPLGIGFTYPPYGYLMKQRYPDTQVTHTHSGWVDFALGQGLPGLLLIWLAILMTFKLGLQSRRDATELGAGSQLWGYITIWVAGGIFIAWVVNEVSEREYIEHLFLIIALFAAGNTSHKQNSGSKT